MDVWHLYAGDELIAEVRAAPAQARRHLVATFLLHVDGDEAWWRWVDDD